MICSQFACRLPELATSKLASMQSSEISTFPLEIASLTTYDRPQIEFVRQFWVMVGSRFLVTAQPISKILAVLEMRIQELFCVWVVIHFCYFSQSPSGLTVIIIKCPWFHEIPKGSNQWNLDGVAFQFFNLMHMAFFLLSPTTCWAFLFTIGSIWPLLFPVCASTNFSLTSSGFLLN